METDHYSCFGRKLKEFGPEADQYKKKVEDMRRMTEIENKTKISQPLTREEFDISIRNRPTY